MYMCPLCRCVSLRLCQYLYVSVSVWLTVWRHVYIERCQYWCWYFMPHQISLQFNRFYRHQITVKHTKTLNNSNSNNKKSMSYKYNIGETMFSEKELCSMASIHPSIYLSIQPTNQLVTQPSSHRTNYPTKQSTYNPIPFNHHRSWKLTHTFANKILDSANQNKL